MSLVNNMLRDLDSRRRATSVGNQGSDKLVPAPEIIPVGKRSWRRVVVALSVLMLAAVVSFLVFQFPENQGQLELSSMPAVAPTIPEMSQQPAQSYLPTQGQMQAQTQTQSPTEVQNQIPIQTQAQVPPETAPASGASSQLEVRLQQLEAQNRALLEAQQRELQLQQLQSQAIIVQQPATTPAIQASATQQSAAAIGQSGAPWINQDWADAPALPAITGSELDTTLAGIAGSATTTRSPRELSLAERDRQQVQLALQQWASGQQLAAFQTLDAFSYQNPDAHNSRETLAKLLIQQGETERAMQAIELGLAIAPNQNGYRKLKARLLLESGAAAEAASMLMLSAPTVVSDTEYHDLLASAYLGSRQHESAATIYQSLLQQNAVEGRWWYGLAAALDALGRAPDALAAYERAIQQASLSPGLRQISQQRAQAIRQNQVAR